MITFVMSCMLIYGLDPYSSTRDITAGEHTLNKYSILTLKEFVRQASKTPGMCVERSLALHDLFSKAEIPHTMMTGKMSSTSKVFHVWIEAYGFIFEGNAEDGAVIDQSFIDRKDYYLVYGVVDTKLLDQLGVGKLRLSYYYATTILICEQYEKEHNMPPTFNTINRMQNPKSEK